MTFEIQEVGPLKEVRAGRIIAEAEYVKDKLDDGALDILGKAQAGIASAAELNALSNAASALIPFERRFRQPTARELILLHLSIASEQGSVSSAEIEDCLEIAGQKLDHRAYALALANAILDRKPFPIGNAAVAASAAYATLRANGFEVDLTRIEEDLTGACAGASDGKKDDRRWLEIAESAVRAIGSKLVKAESLIARHNSIALEPAPGPSFSYQYLTLQDLIWINSEATGRTNSYEFDALEECAFFLYGYGESKDWAKQAGQFVASTLLYRPFGDGNRRTALIGLLSFLTVNGFEFEIPDPDAWLDQIAQRKVHPTKAVKAIVKSQSAPQSNNVREVALDLIHAYYGH